MIIMRVKTNLVIVLCGIFWGLVIGLDIQTVSAADISPPLGLKVIAGSQVIKLLWSANSEKDLWGYEIYRSETELGEYLKVATVYYKTAYRDWDVSSGRIYYYKLKAFNISRVTSDFSLTVQAALLDGNVQADPAKVIIVYNSKEISDNNSNKLADVNEVVNCYLQKRGIPAANLLEVQFDKSTWEAIYDSWIALVKGKLNELGPENIYYIVLVGFPKSVSVDSNPISITTLGMYIYNLSREAKPVRRSANPIFTAVSTAPQTFLKPLPRFNHAIYEKSSEFYYIVSQLDGMEALNQIEGSLYGERYAGWENYLGGKHLIDSHGTYGGTNRIHNDPVYDLTKYPYVPGFSYEAIDYKIAAAVRYFDQKARPDFYLWHPGSDVIGVKQEDTFEDGTAVTNYIPALSYGGWYGDYRNVMNWIPGSFYSQVRSYFDPGWQALLHGASFVCAPMFEPYTDGVVQPFEFVYYILEGYTYGEASNYGLVYVNWADWTSGDPLTCVYAQGKKAEFDFVPPPVPDSYYEVTSSGNVNLFAYLNTIDRDADLAYWKLEYGISPGEYTQCIDYSPLSGYWQNRKFVLSGLKPDTNYYYRFTVQDPAGNETVSEERTFFIPDTDLAPVFEYKISSFRVYEGQSISLSVPPADDPDGTEVEYSYGNTLPGTAVFDPQTRILAWTVPESGATGSKYARIYAQSGGKQSYTDVTMYVVNKAENVWISTGSEDGADAANWSLGHTPDGYDKETAVFDGSISNVNCKFKNGYYRGVVTRNQYSGTMNLSAASSYINVNILLIESGSLDSIVNEAYPPQIIVNSIIYIGQDVNFTNNFKNSAIINFTGSTVLAYGNIQAKKIIFANTSADSKSLILIDPKAVLDPQVCFGDNKYINSPNPFKIFLRSLQEGSQYTLGDEAAASLMEYMDIKDAKAVGEGIKVKNSKDSGNNTGVNFLSDSQRTTIAERVPQNSAISLNAGEEQNFSLLADNPGNNDLSIEWRLDGVIVKAESLPQGQWLSYLYSAPDIAGKHQLQVTLRDSEGSFSRVIWNIEVSAAGKPTENYDINGDEQVNVLDVQACVNVLLESDTDPDRISKAKAVAAPEDKCDVLDVQAVVNKILW